MTVTHSRIETVGRAHLPLRHVVLEEVRRRIVAREWQPGERLFEDQIAHELEVSRNPVREALQALAGEGFVELEPRRGARVATVTAARAAELFEMREALEGLVARLAAERRTDAQLAEMRDIVASGLAAAASLDHPALLTLNTQFHRCLGRASGNHLLGDSIDHLSHIIEWVYGHSIADRGPRSWEEHAGIVDAIATGDADTARRRAWAHIARARQAYLDAAEHDGHHEPLEDPCPRMS